MKLRRKSFLEQISTKPNPDSIKWAGKQFSILSAILLWSMWLCRVLSLLQILKLAYRKLVGWFKTATMDNASGRVNVPPILCEIYFILWLEFFILAHHGLIDIRGNRFLLVLSYYYLFESIVWVLYYTIFRRFFEAGYSIYHELEYLTVLLLVVPTQALCFANIYGRSFRDMLAGLLGSGGDGDPFPVMILGALFGAIVISMIISTFPTEAIKKHHRKTKVFIIGKGDVVKNRLLPALIDRGIHETDIYSDFDITDTDRNGNAFDETKPIKRICHLIHDNVDRDSEVWIETPTYTHVGYLKEILTTSVPLIVLEKPITACEKELEAVKVIVGDAGKRKKIFFLSYYLLEKALPLTYLTMRNPLYEEYLNVDDRLSMENWRTRLGSLRTVNVTICEGEDLREWVYKEAYGGQWIETFFHNVSIASLFCGSPQTWIEVERSVKKAEIVLTAVKGCTKISLQLRKNLVKEERRRFAELVFENGTIIADFDLKNAVIHFDDLATDCVISVKDDFRQKYAVLVDLVQRVKDGECTTEEADGLLNQIEILDWMLKMGSAD